MINSVVLVGRIVNKPEMTYSKKGDPICKFKLAVPRAFKKDETDFINIVTFGKTAQFVAQYLDKGALVGVEGRLQIREYVNKDGVKMWWTDVPANSIQSLEKKGSNDSSDENEAGENDW
ncbi:single-stranded DNA-binding protein [Patescibacteria group bacterium]|nr:single-stranded DNA-binding protein [Patescibacteria group bacterium]